MSGTRDTGKDQDHEARKKCFRPEAVLRSGQMACGSCRMCPRTFGRGREGEKRVLKTSRNEEMRGSSSSSVDKRYCHTINGTGWQASSEEEG